MGWDALPPQNSPPRRVAVCSLQIVADSPRSRLERSQTPPLFERKTAVGIEGDMSGHVS